MLHAESARYDTRDGCRLLDAIDLKLGRGMLMAILGANGAGKSTLLRLLAGDLQSTAGEIRLFGTPLSRWPRRALAQQRAVMPQNPPLPFAFSALEVARLGLDARLPAARDPAIVTAMLARLGVANLAPRDFRTLSGGEQQRVQLARVLAQVWPAQGTNAGLLLLDECTSALDPAQQHLVFDVLRTFASTGGAVIAIVHDINLAARYADHLLLMQQGRILASGSPQDVLTRDHIADAFALNVHVGWHPDGDWPVVLARQCHSRSS